MLCLFDTRRKFLVQKYIPESESMNHEDLLEFQQREENENVIIRRNRDPTNEKIGIQNLTRKLVDVIQTS